ncbi:MAG: hypothetical protein JSW48_02030 [Betaproteobacteria bacterium]|nr:MAG: hypothetical protein JSW48_02030 [Betaproteobacteria bacterium]
MKRLPFVLFTAGLIGMLSLAAIWSTDAEADSRRKFTLEVAMNSALGGFNLPDGGISGRALVGVFNGNIYPKGTLGKGDNDFDPTSDGNIGTWRCHFTGLNTVALPPPIIGLLPMPLVNPSQDFPLTGAVTYYFQLEPTGYDRAESMLIVMGLNSHTLDDNDNVSRVLAVVGGTGRFAGATGEARETLLGRNLSGARNLEFRFRLREVKKGHGYRYGYGYDDDDD